MLKKPWWILNVVQMKSLMQSLLIIFKINAGFIKNTVAARISFWFYFVLKCNKISHVHGLTIIRHHLIHHDFVSLVWCVAFCMKFQIYFFPDKFFGFFQTFDFFWTFFFLLKCVTYGIMKDVNRVFWVLEFYSQPMIGRLAIE